MSQNDRSKAKRVDASAESADNGHGTSKTARKERLNCENTAKLNSQADYQVSECHQVHYPVTRSCQEWYHIEDSGCKPTQSLQNLQSSVVTIRNNVIHRMPVDLPPYNTSWPTTLMYYTLDRRSGKILLPPVDPMFLSIGGLKNYSCREHVDSITGDRPIGPDWKPFDGALTEYTVRKHWVSLRGEQWWSKQDKATRAQARLSSNQIANAEASPA